MIFDVVEGLANQGELIGDMGDLLKEFHDGATTMTKGLELKMKIDNLGSRLCANMVARNCQMAIDDKKVVSWATIDNVEVVRSHPITIRSRMCHCA